MGDLYILNTRCQLTETIRRAFEEAGLVVKVSTESGVSDENLRGAEGFTAICIFVNKKISPEQVENQEQRHQTDPPLLRRVRQLPDPGAEGGGRQGGESPELLPRRQRGG